MNKIPPNWSKWKGVISQHKYVLLMIVLGMVFLMLPTEQHSDSPSTQTAVFDLTEFEEHLAENLSYVQGAGETRVVLTLRNDGQKIYAQDSQTQAQGGGSRSTVTIGSGSSEQVVEVQQLYPQFQGALVICEGGDNPSVQLKLMQAVSALTGLGSDSITVCKSDT